jgi:hypothetical protein
MQLTARSVAFLCCVIDLSLMHTWIHSWIHSWISTDHSWIIPRDLGEDLMILQQRSTRGAQPEKVQNIHRHPWQKLMPKMASKPTLELSQKTSNVRRQMAQCISFVDCAELIMELETTGNKGNEMSLSLPCHWKNRTSCQEGTNSSPNTLDDVQLVSNVGVFPAA